MGICGVCAAIVVASALAGCGGSAASGEGDSATQTSSLKTTLTTSSFGKAQYITQANRICAESTDRMLETFAERYRKTRGKQFAEASKNIFVPHAQMRFDDIQYIGAPEGELQQVKHMTNTLQQDVFDGGEQRITSPQQFAAIFHDFNQMARQYGLRSCLLNQATFEPLSPKP